MVRSVEHYPPETIVVVHAKLRKAEQRVKNATIHDYEFDVFEVHKVGNLTENVPFTVYDAENINREKDDFDEERDDTGVDVEESPDLSVQSSGKNTPRASTDLARIPNLESKSRQSLSPIENAVLIRHSQHRCYKWYKTTTISSPTSSTQQPNRRPSNRALSSYLPHSIWNCQSVPFVPRHTRFH